MHRTTTTLLILLPLLLGNVTGHAADLLEIYQLAQQNDPQLRTAAAANRAAQEIRGQRRSALLPQLNLTGNYRHNTTDVSKNNNQNIATGETEYTSKGYTISLRQGIYNHEHYARLRQTNATIARADAEFEVVKQKLILRVAQIYFNLLAARDSLTTAQANKRAIGQQLHQTKQRFDVGLSAITDVHEAQAGYDSAVATELAAQNKLDMARENLREIIDQEPPELATLQNEVPLLQPEPTDIQQWVTTAGQQNLSLLAAEASVRAAAGELSSRQAGHYPNLDLVASHSYNDSTDPEYQLGSERTDTVIGLELNLSLLAGGGTMARVREARELHTQAVEQLEQQRRTIIRETRSAYLAITAGISHVKARQQALSSAQTALEATRAGFDVGTRTAVDVLNSQHVQFQAQSEYLRSRYDYILATLQLKQAVGVLNRDDLAGANAWLQ